VCIWYERLNANQSTKLSKISNAYFSDKKDANGKIIPHSGNRVPVPPEKKFALEEKLKDI